MGKIEKLFFVDVETTDLSGNDPEAEIIEVACAVLDFSTWTVSAEWSSLVRHTRPMGAFTAEHFAGVDFDSAVSLNVVISALLSIWRASNGAWTGQNPSFDQRFVRRAALMCGIQWPLYPAVDYRTFDLASMLLPYVLNEGLPGVGLRHSREWAGLKGEQTHRAVGYVRDAIKVFKKIMGR